MNQGMLSGKKLNHLTDLRRTAFKTALSLGEALKLFPETEQIRKLQVTGTDEDEFIVDPRTETTEHFQYNVQPISNNNREYCYVCPVCGKIHKRNRGNANRNFRDGKEKNYHEYFVPPCADPELELDLLPEAEEGEYPNFIHIVDSGINTVFLPCLETNTSPEFYGW